MQVEDHFCHLCLDVSCEEFLQIENLLGQEEQVVRVEDVWQP